MMQDYFISTQELMLNSWLEAFPDAKLAFNIAINVDHNSELIFWLHMNMDRQQWMTSTVLSIQQSYPAAKIVVIANGPNQAEAFYALSIGVQGYCHAFSPADILKEIKTVVLHGGIWMGSDLLQQLIEITKTLVGNQSSHIADLLKRLTKREQEVALQASKGLSNKEIARILNITDRTVKAHLSSAFETLGAKDRLHLALMLNNTQKYS